MKRKLRVSTIFQFFAQAGRGIAKLIALDGPQHAVQARDISLQNLALSANGDRLWKPTAGLA